VTRRGVSLRALGVPAYRRFFAAQLISNTGVWFQNLTISLLVATLTGSASALALVSVAQFGPILLLSPLAGRLADAVSPRRVILGTGGVAAAVAATLAITVAGEDPHLPLVYALVVVAGCAAAFERSAAQALVFELVGGELLQNGVVLTTIYLSAARSIGPALAGLAFVGLGPQGCMVIAALGYLVQVALVASIRRSWLLPRPRPEGVAPSVMANLRAVATDRPLLALLAVNVLVTVGAMSFTVIITAVVALQFGGDASALGAAHALNAIGAVLGALLVTALHRVAPRTVVPAVLVFAAVLAINAVAPNLTVLLLVAPILGIGLGIYQSTLNAAAQAAAPPHALGRTMSLLIMGNLGMAPVAALFSGAVIDATSGSTAFAVGAGACALAGAGLALALRLLRPRAVEGAPDGPAAD